MSYDSKTRTVYVGSGEDLNADYGTHFIHMLQVDAREPGASPELKSDWATVEEWLGCAGRELTSDDNELIGRAWLAYYAIGVSPSRKQQEFFDFFAERHKSDLQSFPKYRPPEKIINVFDRLLATDSEIMEKRAADFIADKANRERIAEALGYLSGEPRPSWWRRQSKSFRAWAFVSLVWAVGSWFLILLFDPFAFEDWRWADGRDYLKVWLIILAPVIVGLIKVAYDRTVK